MTPPAEWLAAVRRFMSTLSVTPDTCDIMGYAHKNHKPVPTAAPLFPLIWVHRSKADKIREPPSGKWNAGYMKVESLFMSYFQTPSPLCEDYNTIRSMLP